MKKSSEKNNAVEKRNYFRIDEKIVLDVRTIDQPGECPQESGSDRGTIDRIMLKARFDSMSREMQPLQNRLREKDPLLARYVEVLDRKINMLGAFITEAELSDDKLTPCMVNIGAGGLSFRSRKPMITGTRLEIRMLLLPDNTGIFTLARVVGCERMQQEHDEGIRYRVCVEYVDMQDDVRDQITRYVLQREQEWLKKRKHIR